MAARYFISGGTGDWNSTTNWSATDGGPSGASFPTSADDVFLTAASGANTLTINVTSACLTLNCTGFTGTLAGSGTLSVGGNVTLVATMTLTYNGQLSIVAASTITSNGKALNGTLGIGVAAGTFTVTLVDDLHVLGSFTTISTISLTLNGNNLYVAGDFSVPLGALISGTTNIRLNTTTTQTMLTRTDGANFNCNLFFEASGTIVLTNNMTFGTTSVTSVSVTYVSGTMSIPSNINFRVNAGTGALTLNTSGMTWSNITVPSTGIISLTSDLNISGNFIISGGTVNGNSLNISGSLTINTSIALGTTNYVLNGTGTWSGTGTLRNNLTINTVGTITISGTVNYNTGTLAYIASGGTVNTGSSTLFIGASTTLDTNGITWNNVSLNNGTITLTLTSNFNISGTFTASGLSGALTLTFAGVGQFLPTGAFVTNDAAVNTGGVLTITITLPNNISISSFTYTDNSGAANRRNVTLNGNRNIFISSDVYLGSTRGSTISGTCTLVPSGLSNNFTLGVTGGAFSGIYSIPVNFSGNYTIIGNPLFTSTTITYTSGNITGAACIFTTCTLNLNSGGLWGTDVTIRGNTTLTSNATFGNITTNTTTVVFSGAFTINVEGNLAINVATSGASTPIVLNGTGSQSWTHGSAVYLSNNLTINKASGTLTIGTLALPNIYYNTGTLTYNNIGGIVDAATNNSTLNLITVSTLNTNGIIWNNVSATSGTHSIASNFYCNNFSSSNSAINFNNTGGDIYLYKSLTQGVAQLQGTATIYFVGGVTWNQTSLTANYHVKNNIVIDTSETVTFGSYVAYSTGTLTHKRGKVNAKGCTFSIQTATTTLINCNKINFDRVVIDAGLTVIMNEFFNGSPELQTAVSSTTTTNAIITFTDNFEKIAKFVNTNGITFTRPQQLLLLTNQPKKSRNRGIRYNNQSPNGIAKGNPSVTNTLTPGLGSFLVSEPIYN